jgi:acyl-coenzyme A synthetase/AMP-(fatty) acid ligase
MNNFSQQIQEKFLTFGQTRAVIFQKQTVSYAEFADSITGAANFFKKQGICAGDRVMLRADDSPDWLYTLLGLIYVGAVPVILSTQFMSARASEIAAESDCRLAVINNKDNLIGVDCVRIENILFDDTTPIVAHNYDPNEIGLIIASSGTSGKKNKLVVHGHRSWYASTDALNNHYSFPHDEIVFATSKLSFQYVWAKVFATLWNGETLIIHDKLLAGIKLLKFIKHHQITRLITSPPILLTLAKVNPKDTVDTMNSIRMLISGGEPVRDHVETDILKLYNQRVYQCWGSSEVITVPIAQNYNNQRTQSIGKKMDAAEIKIINEEGNIAKVNEVGEMHVKINCVAFEYLNDPEATQEAFHNGWFKTNDLARADQDGFYFFVGRKNDVKKVKGVFVSPLEIELAMLHMPEIKDCIVGIDTKDNGKSVVVANVLLEDNIDSIAPEKIRSFLTSCLESYKIPRVIKFINEIPRTVTGKKIRSLIQK